MFTLRITVGRDGNGLYVLGNGLAFGALSAPAPGPDCAATGSAASSSVARTKRERIMGCSSDDWGGFRDDPPRKYAARPDQASGSAAERVPAERDVVGAKRVHPECREVPHHRRVVHGPCNDP